MPRCWAVGCSKSHKDHVRMLRFPSDIKRRELWCLQIRRPDPATFSLMIANDAARLCSDHFDADQFEESNGSGAPRIKKNAIPTIFHQNAQHKKSKIQRQEEDKTPVQMLDHTYSGNFSKAVYELYSFNDVEVSPSMEKSQDVNSNVPTSENDHTTEDKIFQPECCVETIYDDVTPKL